MIELWWRFAERHPRASVAIACGLFGAAIGSAFVIVLRLTGMR